MWNLSLGTRDEASLDEFSDFIYSWIPQNKLPVRPAQYDENGNLKDTTRLIDELGEKFRQMDEGRAQALGKLVKMTPQVITALRTGMMDYGREFDQMLGSMTPAFDEAVKAAQRLHSAQSRLVRVMGLLWQGIATRFFGPFEKAFDTIRTAITAASQERMPESRAPGIPSITPVTAWVTSHANATITAVCAAPMSAMATKKPRDAAA